VIVRIMGEGQFDLPDGALDELNRLDDDLEAACAAGDEATFRQALTALAQGIHDAGSPLPDDYLGPSDLVLPGRDASLSEVSDLLTDEGLIPD
jgi:PspAA-like protein